MLGPCFTAPKLNPETCGHADEHRFAWFARDDTAKDGRVLVQVCMACDTVLLIGTVPRVQPVPPAPDEAPDVPPKRRRKKL